MSTILRVQRLNAWQSQSQVLFDIHLNVMENGITALIGAKGAGKSSLLEALFGLIRTSGRIRLNGKELQGEHPAQIAQAGLSLVPEERQLFTYLTVEENLLAGASSGRLGHWNLESIYTLFPTLYPKRHQPSGALCSGQQQRVAIARGLMANPKVLLCDEISHGLPPTVASSIYQQLPIIAASGTALILVEQNLSLVLEKAHYLYALHQGRIVLEGEPATLDRNAISQVYFGVDA